MNQEKLKELEKIVSSDYGNTAGIIILKYGKTLYENYFNKCTAASTIHIASVTKSIISILIGIALDSGYIKSIDQKVLDFFPDYPIKNGEKTMQNVTIKDMLSMTAPYKHKEEPYIEYFTGDSWVETALDFLGGTGSIGNFRYTPMVGPDILSGILVKATGQSVLHFATENLFSPLGITSKQNVILHDEEETAAFQSGTNINGWTVDSQGINSAAWGLTMTAMDMAKIGQLYLAGGVWNGKQIISAKWINESTNEHSRWKEFNLAYGYLWWVLDDKEHVYAAMGDGGNVIYVNTKKELVISIASLFMAGAKDRIELINEYIEVFEKENEKLI